MQAGGETVQLEGVVEFVLFVRDDGFTVLRAAGPNASPDGAVTAVGRELAGARPGETLRMLGRWTDHPRFGQRFAVESCERADPAGARAIRMYLSSGLVRGIGPLLAQAITERFGEQTLEVIDREPARLAEVYGIGERRSRRIAESWRAQKTVRELMGWLRGHGVSPLLADPIYREFGEDALEAVSTDPYRMVGVVDGVAFAIADRIALERGGSLEAPERLEAAVWEVCAVRARRAGHCFLPYDEAVIDAAALAGQDVEPMRFAAARLTAGRGAALVEIPHPETGELLLAPRSLRRAERRLARALAVLAGAESDMPRPVRRRVKEDRFGQDLHPGQREAVRMALTHTVSVLTGGPGCGKSHTVREIVGLVREGGGSVTLAAPTGKAARRLAELTGAQAMTVHRLAADPGGPQGAEGGALFGARTTMVHMIVVDEASMLDVHLAGRLAETIPAGTHLLLVGDDDQLPSVGPGSVLADLLAVSDIARTHLTHVFRQARDSTITANAHLIRAGRVPDVRRADFWFAEMDDPNEIARTTVEIATRRLPAKLGADPASVQVLCPTRRGAAGTLELCRLLQAERNPRVEGEQEYWAGARVFRAGDRVMAARNDYAKGEAGIFNGTLGTICDLDLKDGRVGVLTDDGEQVSYEFTELDDLIHAYALSVHKAQGSEFDHVVAALTLDAPLLLTRSLLYTLVTRARKTVVLVGQPAALRRALDTAPPARNTLLSHALTEYLAGPAASRAADLDLADEPDGPAGARTSRAVREARQAG
jgi:exodeoxyribonuclease V alpha subunit